MTLAKPLTIDAVRRLRRVAAALEAGELTTREIAAAFGCSLREVQAARGLTAVSTPLRCKKS